MSTKTTNRHRKPPTLSVAAAARAAGVDRDTLARRLAEANEQPDNKRRFTIAQVVRALTAGIQAAKMKRATAECELAELTLAKARNELMPTSRAVAVWGDFILKLKGDLQALPDKLATRFSLWPNQAACRDDIFAAVAEIAHDVAKSPRYDAPPPKGEQEGEP